MDVQRALLRENVLIPAGNMKIGRQDLQIFTNALRQTLLDIPVHYKDGQPIRLGTVAKITDVEGPAVVNHRNIGRVTDVYVNVGPETDVGGVVEKNRSGSCGKSRTECDAR